VASNLSRAIDSNEGKQTLKNARTYFFLPLIALVTMASFFFLARIAARCSKTTSSTEKVFNLSPEECLALKKKSDEGDSDAALRLFDYYEFSKNDINTVAVYLKRSIQLGNARAKGYSFILGDDNKEKQEQQPEPGARFPR